MVKERFKIGGWTRAQDRFERRGRLQPLGLIYLMSWSNQDRRVCYQLMETLRIERFALWFSRWDDIVDFDLVPFDSAG